MSDLAAANKLAAILASRESDRIVLAESCTCGMAAALLGGVPGISNFLCGSLVTYRESAKQSWIGVEASTLSEFTAESMETTEQMAIGALLKTSEANFSAAITGNLGPNVESEVDGLIFIVTAERVGDAASAETDVRIWAKESYRLTSDTRVARQVEAAKLMLEQLSRTLQPS